MSKLETSKVIIHTKSLTKEVPTLKRILWICNIVYYQILAVTSLLLIWTFFEKYQKDNARFWHTFFSTVSFVPLMAGAIILFSEDNLLALHISRTKRYTIHGILLASSVTLLTAGIFVETWRKNHFATPLKPAQHFHSTHAKLGIAAWTFCLAAVLLGLIAANTKVFSTFIRPLVVKLVHNILGMTGFALGIAALWHKMTILKGQTTHILDASYYALGYVAVWSCLAAVESLYGQLKTLLT